MMVRINGIEVKKCSQCPYFFDFETYFRLPAKEKGYGYPEGYNVIGCKQVFSLCPLRNNGDMIEEKGDFETIEWMTTEEE